MISAALGGRGGGCPVPSEISLRKEIGVREGIIEPMGEEPTEPGTRFCNTRRKMAQPRPLCRARLPCRLALHRPGPWHAVCCCQGPRLHLSPALMPSSPPPFSLPLYTQKRKRKLPLMIAKPTPTLCRVCTKSYCKCGAFLTRTNRAGGGAQSLEEACNVAPKKEASSGGTDRYKPQGNRPTPHGWPMGGGAASPPSPTAARGSQ